MHVHDSSKSRCGAREAMTVGCKPTINNGYSGLYRCLRLKLIITCFVDQLIMINELRELETAIDSAIFDEILLNVKMGRNVRQRCAL